MAMVSIIIKLKHNKQSKSYFENQKNNMTFKGNNKKKF